MSRIAGSPSGDPQLDIRNRLTTLDILGRERFALLLLTLLLYLGLAPFLKGWITARLLMSILLSAVLLSTIYAVSQTRRQAVLVSFLAVPMFATTWLSYVLKWRELTLASHLFSILFVLITVVMILHYVMVAKRVTRDVICAAIVVYLMIGVMGSLIYALLQNVSPGSFSIAEAAVRESAYVFVYYSFVTLTTLGYGDVTPLTDQARALSFLEAVVGQLYVAVLIARLVGIQISQAIAPDGRQNHNG